MIANRNYLVIDGKNSLDFDTWISAGGAYNAPSRDVETVAIPGRNGLLSLDNGRFNNIDVIYPSFIVKNFEENAEALRAFLLSRKGYFRLEDTYHPDQFRMALYTSGIDIVTTARNLGGSFDLTFNCKPQRFLKCGDQLKAVASGTIIFNPTLFEALPLIRVYGSGSVSMGAITVTVGANEDPYIDIDCDLQEAFYDGESRNQIVTHDFPHLGPGENSLTYSGFSRVEVRPRYWTL